MTADWFAAALRHDRAVVLGGLAAVVTLAWAYLLLGAGIDIEMMDMGGGRMMAMLPEWTPSYGFVVFVMWCVMMVAMMLPSVAPVTLLVARIARGPSVRRPGMTTMLFIAGYLAVWFGFSACATLLQWQLEQAVLLSQTMALGSRATAAALLIVAGLYQWTPLKQACLRHCRSPLEFILFHWRADAFGAFVSGIRHGAFCLGCCWMLMLLLFVGGIMNLAWIAAIALLVLIEKAAPAGNWVGRATGAAMVVWGVVAAAMAV
jgi:predicted metal-binding membrane protein